MTNLRPKSSKCCLLPSDGRPHHFYRPGAIWSTRESASLPRLGADDILEYSSSKVSYILPYNINGARVVPHHEEVLDNCALQ